MIFNLLMLVFILILLFYVLKKKENFSLPICSNFTCVNDNCSITEETKICKDTKKKNSIPNCYYDKIVDPKNPECIDFCVKTYTYKDGEEDFYRTNISKQFIGKEIHSYFSSKCNECIDNYYERIKLITDS